MESKAGTTKANGATPKRSPDTNGDQTPPTRSGPIAAAGVSTGEDFAALMSALMSDLIDGSVSPNIANATVNAGGKLLKVVEMQYRYGSPKEQKPLTLTLAPGR